MTRDPEALTKQTFDLVVIGGGINGAATAREAALRGWKVALLEARDFASGTSSRSSKLIHGGLRYLAQGDFRLVQEARRERRLLMQLAPHLARPLPFLLPIYAEDPFSPLKIRLGLTLYDFFGNLGPQDRHQVFIPSETLKRVPALRGEGLRAGGLYYDSETDDARLTIENVIDAVEHGAQVINYAEVSSFAFRSNGRPRVASVEVRDRLTGKRWEIAGRHWVNATGPWVDRVRGLAKSYDGSQTIRMTKGVHVILPSISEVYAVFAAVVPGDRIVVAMPWHGCTLFGTTDTDYGEDPGAAEPENADVHYLLNAMNRILRVPVRQENVIGSFAGIRALAAEPGQSPSSNTREYRFHRDPWANNMITVCGGKLTTSRALAEKLVDLITAEAKGELPSHGPEHPTRARPLPGGATGPFEKYAQAAAEEAIREFRVSADAARRIIDTYGSRWRKVLEPVLERPSLREPLPGGAGILAAEVEFARREEMAMTAEDFLLRRSGLSWKAEAHPELVSAATSIFTSGLAS
jgi:glycerol-3-phosphate dehydrogenase